MKNVFPIFKKQAIRIVLAFVVVSLAVLGFLKVQESLAAGAAPLGYWRFDEGTGTRANSSVNPNYYGTLTGTTWQTDDMCVSGKCLQFNGSSDKADTSELAALTLGKVDFSASIWLKYTSTAFATVMAWRNESSSTNTKIQGIFTINRATTDGTAWFETWAWQTSATRVSSQIALNDDKWHHLEAVYTSSDDTVRFYVDGIQRDSQTQGGGGAGIDTSSNFKIVMGANTGSIQYFPGFLDEVKVYNYARTAAQVKLDYNSKAAAISKGAGTIMGATPTDSLNKGLVGYWKMDEASWTNDCSTLTVTDSSGNGNNGKSCPNGSGPTTNMPAKFGKAGYFDGSNDYVRIENSTTLNPTSALTISAWIYPRDTTAEYDRVVQKAWTSDAGPWNEYAINRSASAQTYQFCLGFTDSSGACATTTSSAPLNAWTHLVGTYDGTVMKIYFNGVQEGSTATNKTIQSNTIPVYIAANYYNREYVNGDIDEVRIYNRTLSQMEINQLYNFAPAPIGYWKFDDATGNSVSDSSINGNAGSWSNQYSNSHWSQGKFNYAGNFNGVNDYVTVTDTAILNPGKITVSAWVKTSAAASDYIVYKYNPNSPWQGYALGFSASNQVSFWDGGGAWVNGTTNVADNRWHYLTGTYDGTTTRVYVDGVFQGSAVQTASMTYAVNLNIGAYGGSNYFFPGSIDDVKIYNYARTPDQIMEDMQGRTDSGVSLQGVTSGGKSAVAYWKMDEGYGTKIYDSSLRGNTGTLGGNTGAAAYPTWVDGRFGRALNFNGTSNFISIFNDDTALHLDQSKPITFSMWLNPSSEVGQRDILIYSDADIDDGDNNWNGISQIRIFSNDGGTVTFLYGPSPWTAVASTTALKVGSWAYVVVVRDIVNKQQCIYINAKLDKCSADTTSGTWETTGQYLMLGRYKDNSSSDYYAGMMDEIKVYDYALTQSEINQEYNRGAAVVLGAVSDTSQLSGGTVASQSASAQYCIPGDSTSCAAPVGEWNFEEASGATVNDISSGGNAGTWYGNGVHWAPGLFGWSGQFNGDTDYVDLGNKTAFAFGTAATFEVWAYPTKLQSGFLFNKWSDGLEDKQFGLQSDGSVQFYLYNLSGGALKSQGKLPLNKWSHVVGVYDGSKEYIYINGVLDNWQYASGDVADSTGSLYFGKNPGRAGVNSPFAGRLDRILFFNYARTPAQIAWDYNRGAPIGWWKLDEGTGQTVYDSSVNGSNGTLGADANAGADDPTWNSSGKYNSALQFNGTSQYVKVSGSALGLSQSFTASAWIWTSASNPVSWSSIIMGLNSSCSTNNGYYIVRKANTNNIRAGFYDSGGTEHPLDSNGSINLSSWNQVTVTYDYSTGSIKLYLNGKLDNSTSIAANTAVRSNTIACMGVNNSGNYFTGLIDEPKVYNYALTAAQIKQDYNQRAAIRFGP